MSTTDTITVTTNHGDVLPLRATTARAKADGRPGNTYWATLARKADGSRYFSRYGVNVSDSVISELPNSVEVCGKSIPLSVDHNEKGHKRVRGDAKVMVPGVGNKQFSLRITQLAPSTFNVSASIRGISEAPGPRVQAEL